MEIHITLVTICLSYFFNKIDQLQDAGQLLLMKLLKLYETVKDKKRKKWKQAVMNFGTDDK